MNDTAKYLIRATIAADGVVERSDVVGAVFGQTEGLLGDELDLRDLQESSKVGRIDVAIQSENGQSFGEVTVGSGLDKVETAILAAALETIDRIGPCEASVEVTSIEDVRAAKRREVVERAKELVASGFEETNLASTDVLEEVRDAARIEGVTEYEGLPAGPRVGDSDAVIIVEGRADVSTLLECGIKNAVAVEGTNVPDAVATLTESRTVTAFLDGDRGGELILRELAQVGDVDYVAFAPPGESVEDLDRGAVFESLRGKVPYETLADEPSAREVVGNGELIGERDSGGTDGAERDVEDRDSGGTDGAESATEERETGESATEERETGESNTEERGSGGSDAEAAADTAADPPDGSPDDSADIRVSTEESETTPEEPSRADASSSSGSENAEHASVDPETTDDAETGPDDRGPRSLEEHVQEVVDAESGLARLLDADLSVLREVDAADAFDAVESADEAPHVVVVDGHVDQRLLDVSAQRGVTRLLGREVGEFVKQPIGTRVLTVGDLSVEA